MKATPILIALGLCISANAQNLDQAAGKTVTADDVQKAIQEFNRLKSESKKKANEVTVVLEPPAPRAKEVEEPEPVEETKSAPVLVTGKPKLEAEPEAVPQPVKPVETIAEEVAAPVDLIEAQDTTEPGLEVRVESVRKGSGKLDPTRIKLRSRFPAKPLSGTPDGWQLEKTTDAPPVVREIELQPGTIISLEISPHVLTPEVDGANVFAVNEPGFNALDGYSQKQTVSAILAKSVSQLDEDAKHLGTALSELQQILSSLPKPDPAAQEPSKP